MALLTDKDRVAVEQQFTDHLTLPVKLVFFTEQDNCLYCDEIQGLLEELAALSPLLSVEVHDFEQEAGLAAQFGIDKTPAFSVQSTGQEGAADRDYGIRFYGIPSGYEFISLLEAIKLVGSGRVSLSKATLDKLASLQQPLHLQVFVTPTCPYCPQAVVLAHQLAFASGKVTADMVEAMEFPELSDKYSVMGVPRTVINETTFVEGAVPEALLISRLPHN